MTRDRSKDIEFLDMPWPVAILAALSACLVLKILISIRLVFGLMGMEPSAYLLDLAVIDRHAYAFGSSPKRGDVVELRTPERLSLLFRVVGEPGDSVAVVGGRVALNGEWLKRRCRDPELPPEPLEDSESVTREQLIEAGAPANLAPDLFCSETWPGVSRDISTLNWSAGGATNFPDAYFTTPRRRYFLVSDNRTAANFSLYSTLMFQTHPLHLARKQALERTVAAEDIEAKVLFVIPTTKHFFCPRMEQAGAAERPGGPCVVMKALERLGPLPSEDGHVVDAK